MGSSPAFSAHKIYIDSCEIRPAMQRGQQNVLLTVHVQCSPSASLFSLPVFPRAAICPSPSCSDFSSLLLHFALLATALCSWGTARSQLQGGELCYPTTNPVAATPGWKLRENCTETGKLSQECSIAVIRIS